MRKTISAAFIFSFAVTGLALPREEVRRDFQKTVNLSQGKLFRIDTSLGSVRVRTQPQREASITARIRCSADTTAEAKNICDQIHISVQETAAGVSVVTEYPSSYGRATRNVGYGVDFDIALPDNTPLDAKNRFGNVTVNDLHAPSSIDNSNGNVAVSGGRGRQEIENAFGKVEVHATNGDVVVRHGNGDAAVSDITGNVEITDRFGKVTVLRATGGVIVNSSNGQVDVSTVGGTTSIANTFGEVAVSEAGSDVTVNNQNGAVRAANITGSAALRTTFGRIDFNSIGKMLNVRASNSNVSGENVGDSATIETTFGSVSMRGMKNRVRVTASNTSVSLTDIAGEVYARTTFNGVNISNAAGPVTVESQNGSVTVESRSPRCQTVSLSTTFGPIRITVPDGVGYNISARTTFGQITTHSPVTTSGTTTAGSLQGTIGGGGCSLRLVGQNANIDILNGAK
jgi:hypothetical protein